MGATRVAYKRIGKPDTLPDEQGVDFGLVPVRLGPDEIAIEWSAVFSSKVLPRWRNYRRKHKGNFTTAREARAFIRAFIQKEKGAVAKGSGP